MAVHSGARTAGQIGAAAHCCRAAAWLRSQWRRKEPRRSRLPRETRDSACEQLAGSCRRRADAAGATWATELVPGRQRGQQLAPSVQRARRDRVRAVLARPAPVREPSRHRREWEKPSVATRCAAGRAGGGVLPRRDVRVRCARRPLPLGDG
eukprot:2703428-Pleurochrysis_carterae.AAC.1